MLPFSSFGFFVVSFALIGLIHFFKPFLASKVAYPTLIASLTFFYVILAVPRGHLLVIYAAIIFFLMSVYIKKKISLGISLGIIIFPLVVSKLKLVLPEDWALSLPKLGVIGLSYVTFRGIQLLMDCRFQPVLDFKKTFSFLLFPPTLLAGPIDRSYRFCPDIENGYQQLTAQNILNGLYLLTVGYIFKNFLSVLVESWWLARFPQSSQALHDMLGQAYGYTVFLYFDFAGYSLMAMGMALMLGISLPANFDKPWFASNPREFWQRFHITLGSFLNDYFFKPIYKKLASKSFFRSRRLFAQNIALFLTFLLMGCWNGLTWHYIVSGMMFGLASVLHNSFAQRIQNKLLGGVKGHLYVRLYGVIGWLVLCNYIVCALYLFSGRVPV